LFERECSAQRRHQKILEESPSPVLAEQLRQEMAGAALAAARAAGYRNAGTIEFLVEGGGPAASFFFLEMNTRLQVEHPVTEEVTGVDLVRAQLDVARGEPLPWTQAELTQRGHAIECRIYAEDPAHDFLPQAGPLLLYREPSGPGVRVDAGVSEGDVVGVNYDPLLAKLIASGETREAARARALAALRAYPILGIRTNIPFLIKLLELDAFRDGRLHTGLIDEHWAELSPAEPPVPAEALAAAVFATPPGSSPSPDHRSTAAAPDPWSTLGRWGR
jgi:acetyl/propionyl-CoA carboxylase alpha subunit